MPLVIAFSAIWVVLLILFIRRVNSVGVFRIKLIDLVYDHRDWAYRKQVFLSVTYWEMCLQFWRPLTVQEWYGDQLPEPGPGEHFLESIRASTLSQILGPKSKGES